MKQFTSQYTATVQRQTYALDVSTFGTVATITGSLRALDLEASSQNGIQYGYGYSFIAEIGANLKVGDKLVINAQTYTVRGLANYGLPNSATAFTKALIVLPE